MSANQTTTLMIAVIIGAAYVLLARWFVREYPGDRFIQFGRPTLAAALLMFAFDRIPHFPEWLLNTLFFLVLLLAFTSLVVGCQQIYRYVARRKTHTRLG
jgi:hypothetical protein